MTLSKRISTILAKEIDPAFAARAEFIFSHIEKTKPKKVLDVGSGRGFYLRSLAGYKFIDSLIGIETKDEYLSKANSYLKNRKAKLMKGDVYALPFKDNSFDCVILSEVLEHLGDEKKALKEINRVLKRHGSLLLTVPHHDFPWHWDPVNFFLLKVLNTHVRHDWWFIAGIWADHERLYTEKKLRKVIEKNRFEITNLKHTIFYSWPFTHLILYGIGKNIIEKIPGLSLNRFQTTKKSIAGNFLAFVMRLPNKIGQVINSKNKNGVGLVVLARKK